MEWVFNLWLKIKLEYQKIVWTKMIALDGSSHRARGTS
jgi:hypothetical protein